jgi:hypothetical protein
VSFSRPRPLVAPTDCIPLRRGRRCVRRAWRWRVGLRRGNRGRTSSSGGPIGGCRARPPAAAITSPSCGCPTPCSPPRLDMTAVLQELFGRCVGGWLNGDTSIRLTYLIFDLLGLDGTELKQRPYTERRSLLEQFDLEGRTGRSLRHSMTGRRCTRLSASSSPCRARGMPWAVGGRDSTPLRAARWSRHPYPRGCPRPGVLQEDAMARS